MNIYKYLLLLTLILGSSISDAKFLDSIFKKKKNKLDATEINNINNKYFIFIKLKNKQELSNELESIILDVLYNNLSIVSKINTENIDEEQISYLVNDTRDESNQILATFGFVENEVKTFVDDNNKQVNVIINLNKRISIKDVKINIRGDINQEPDYLRKVYNNIENNFILSKGKFFTQLDWEQSKNIALRSLLEYKYPLARIEKSLATLDLSDYKANINIELNSGPPIKFGKLFVEGAKRYPEKIVKDQASFNYGEPFDLNKITKLQDTLGADPHYASAIIKPNLEDIKDNHVDIMIILDELAKKQIDLGLIYDSKEGFGVNFQYSYYNLFNKGYVGSISSSWNKYDSYIALGINQPLKNGNHYFTSNINFSKKNSYNVSSNEYSFSLSEVYRKNDIEYVFGIETFYDSSKIMHGGPKLNTAYVSMLSLSMKINRIQTKIRPQNGYYLLATIGSTIGSFASTTNMQKYFLNTAYYYTPKNKKNGTFLVKSTIGYIDSHDKINNSIYDHFIPENVLFKTGGSNSVRGYSHNEIGIIDEKQPRKTVLGGKVLATFTLEYQYPFKDNFAFAVFHDMGDVKNRFKDFKWKHSTGIGIRWYNVLAPISFDIAYKHNTIKKEKKYGWHLMLGTSF